jgi:CTP:molybdopterin cytidylyltransferase MocA
VIAAIVLAAGSGSRFGGPKQVAVLRGASLVRRAVEAAHTAGIRDVVVVVGSDSDAVAAAAGHGVRIARNESWREGQSTSLRAGLDALDDEVDAAVVLLADQPGITDDHVRRLLDAASTRTEPIVRLRFSDAPGPALLRREIWDEARALTGDTGARALVERRPELVLEVRIDEPAPADVDTREDLDRLRGPDAGNEKPPSL